ncbi:PD-(D/E)XK nuclease family protein [Gemella sp. zg-570]|uniref:PD-(D/E)XK nuclease family protein n=1 Tax=Gemella sp. zg-570 TaxID=2840371 RepID=UPI001C0BE9FA|nr:PD-(D/E)XK nuclease family protein [Gemella sp. zg-570]QWQ38228.1 PD-(D/E)XK nuclease family protein [Gemella sp. zg-570]
MNLEFLVSPSGLGKTSYILDDIEKNKKNNKIIVLTPEQNGYNFEKLLCDRFKGTFNIDVMNFNSMAKNFAKKLNIDNKILEEEARLFYYLDIAERLKNSNNFLISRILQDVNFISVVDNIISEFKEYNISLEMLENHYNNSLDANHKEKIFAILEIYREYLLFLDRDKKYDKFDFFKIITFYMDYLDLSDYIFYIDAYYNFSSMHYAFIEKLLQKSKKVTISLISDIDRYTNFKVEHLIEEYNIENLEYNLLTLEDVNNNFKYSLDIFRKSHEVVAYINDIIKRNKILSFNLLAIHQYKENNYTIKFNVENNKILDFNIINVHANRYKNNSLNYLVAEYPKVSKSYKFETDEFLKIYEAENIELEVKQVARNICNLKKENNMNDRDFVILYRDDSYEDFINIFNDYGIKIHLDKDLDVANHRLIKLIFNIFNYRDEDFTTSILNILKTQLTNFENIYKELLLKYIIFNDIKVPDKDLKEYIKNNDIPSLENCRIINILDVENILKMKLVKKYDDLHSEYYLLESKNSKYKTFELEIVKEILETIVVKIKKVILSKKVKNYISNLDELLNYFDIKMLLNRYLEHYDSVDDLQQESIDRQVYTKFLNILESINKNVGSKTIDYNDFKELLFLAINKIKYRNIPEILNSVIMAKMDLAKVENKKIAFIIGFNKDILPKTKASESILDDSDKDKLFNSRLIISPTNKSMIIDEEFVSYISLSRVSDKIFISYTKLSNDFKETSSSIYLNTIKNIFPSLKINKVDDILRYKIKNLDYYTNNLDKIYSYKEANYLFMKFIQSYKSLISTNSKENSQIIKKLMFLINTYNKILNNNLLSNKVDNVGLNIELTDELFYKDINNNIFYNNELLDINKFFISDELRETFIKSKDNFNEYSSSKISEYVNNPYKFFFRRILGVSDVENYDINFLNTGSFFHAIMDNKVVKNYILEKSELISSLYEEDEYSIEISKLNIREMLINEINNSNNKSIRDYLILISSLKTNNYIMEKIITRLTLAIEIEINYMAISKFKFYDTEKKFKLEFSKDSVIYKQGKEVIEKTLPRQYNIPNIVFKGTIDRIDFKGDNYLIIDYKSSKNDFDLNKFYNGEISQILCYILALQLILNKKTENIFGAFYREIYNGKEKKEYRLRGLVNKDLFLQEDYSNLIFTRVTKSGDINAADAHKAYNSNEMEKLIAINIDNLLSIVEKIYNFDFQIDDELRNLYNFANEDSKPLEKNYENISKKDLRKLILKKL